MPRRIAELKIMLKLLSSVLIIFALNESLCPAASVTASDGGTAVYGNCNGFAIDFDSTVAPNASWAPALVAGQSYVLNSVAVKNSTGNAGSYYLGVYTGFNGGTLSGFKGISDAAQNFSTSPNNWLTFTFSNLNYNVTVDSTVGSGSGLLYFVYQSGTTAITSPNVVLATDKFSADTYMTNSLSSIIAFGALVANRSPQYQATITSTAPTQPPSTPTGLTATGSNAAVMLTWTPPSGANGYNIKRSVVSGSGYVTVTTATGTKAIDSGLTNGTAYYYVVSATNSIGESPNSTEASATPLPPPDPPANLTAIASNTSVALTWNSSPGATSYRVKRSPISGGGYVTVTNLIGTNWLDANLAYNATFYYVVSALNSNGEGANSSEASATTSGLPDATVITNSLGMSVSVGSNAIYQVNFAAPQWIFMGALPQAPANRVINSGSDSIGDYSEIAFNYSSAVPHIASIRLYNVLPITTFNDSTLAAGPNDLSFPRWTSYPSTAGHLSFGNIFSPYNFTQLFDDNLWLFFNTNHDAFILSAATNFMVSSTIKKGDGSISCGINSSITQLPAGFTHRVILTAQNGINGIYSTWGNALMALAQKTPPANDAAVELNKIGYWTDNGAAYHYTLDQNTIASTLVSVKSEYQSKGIQLGYLQLDSWWYEKGTCQCWYDSFGADGTYLWIPDPVLFTNGLAGFQQQIGLPFFLHNRWIATNSPYVTNYQMSANVCIDPNFWTNIMSYVQSIGGCTYEQDWLGYRGTPLMNLTDGPAYLNNMAGAAAAYGINVQYCMNQGRDYLQASLYTNVVTTRDCPDVFDTPNWANFLYGAPMTHAVGVWAWTDVYSSSATRNLLISTLSAGPVGCGDPLGSANGSNLLKAVRPDGVIVKPDVPLAPVDDAYANDALGWKAPMVSTTYTDHTNSRALYVFAFGETATNLSTRFRPADFGISSNAYIYNYFAATGTVLAAGNTFNFTTAMPNGTNGGSYFIAVPFGPSGIAFLGDTNKFTTLGKKRIPSFSDTGVAKATVAFAAGETNVTLSGYSPSLPYVLPLAGSTNNFAYDPTTHLFSVNVSPDGSGVATVAFSLTPLPSLSISPTSDGQFQISWPVVAIGYSLEKTTNISPPVFWSMAPEPITSSNNQNIVTLTNTGATWFYRLKQ